MNLDECRDAFCGLGVKNSEAVRKFCPEEDEDGCLFNYMKPFEIDRVNKFMISKSIKRLQLKTQVLIRHPNSHVSVRFSHVCGTANIAKAIASILGINSDLCEAGAIGHDIGHTPFGHIGEKFIYQVTGKKFRHEQFGVVVAREIERNGEGLNLCVQVENIIRWHSRGSGKLTGTNKTLEADVVMYADKLDYFFSDQIDIFERTKSRKIDDFPVMRKSMDFLGSTYRERISKCIKALCIESAQEGKISFHKTEVAQRFLDMKQIMYDHVYDELDRKIGYISLEVVYAKLVSLENILGVDSVLLLALMTDEDVLNLYEISKKRNITMKEIRNTSVGDLIGFLRNKEIDWAKDPM